MGSEMCIRDSFKKYEPVCSVFLRNNSVLELQKALDDKVDFVYNKISQLT